MIELATIVGTIVTVVSFGFALWEYRSRKRLEDFVRAQNWAMFSKASNANGHTQTALIKYKALGAEKINHEVLELLSKADAFGQDVFKDVVRQIRFSEAVFDHDTIDRWETEGRIDKKYGLLFRELAPADKKRQKEGPSSGL